jgi:predicted MPP superfamily phosphohydrolase
MRFQTAITRRQVLKGLAASVALPTGLGGYAFGIEPRFRLVTVHHEIVSPSWRLPPLRIVALADIHACEPWMPVSRIAHIVEEANALSGDIVCLLGDYVPGLKRFRTDIVPIREWAAALGNLFAPLGVHAVLGNHDWWANERAVRIGLEAEGVEVYQNRAVPLTHAGWPFWLAGTDSMFAYGIRKAKRLGGADDIEGTLAQMDDGAPAILMAHEPDMFPRVPARIALTLSGHTHGGQVRLPFVGRPVIPTQYGERYAWGHVHEGGRDLVVSAGLGCSIFPVRFGVPPEITVVTLKGPDALM